MNEEENRGLFVADEDRAVTSAEDAAEVEQPAALPDRPEGNGGRRSSVGELMAVLERIEHALGEVRGALSATAHEQRHREFSPARLIGTILQALVAGLILWAVSDWAFGEPRDVLLTKLAFAMLFQLSALTAFILGRRVE